MSEGLQPASVSTEASSASNSNDSAVGIGISGGEGGTHDQPNLDEELEEHTFDENPDYDRIREDSHLDGGEYTLDEGEDDDPGEGLAGSAGEFWWCIF